MQIILNGLIWGLATALLALAFTITYLPTRVFHIALGGVYVAAPLVAWACLHKHCSWFFAVVTAVFVCVSVSMLCELFNHARLEKHRGAPAAHMISSLGIYIVIVQALALIWGNETKVLSAELDKAWKLGSVTLTRSQLIEASVSVLLLCIFFAWLRYSGLGLRFRAVASNPTEAALRGINVRRLRLGAFGLSGGLAAASALLMSLDIGFSSQGGLATLLLAVVAAIVGGRGSFAGPVLGALLLGLARSVAVWYLSARWQEAVTFLLLAVFLYLLPGGLLNKAERLEART